MALFIARRGMLKIRLMGIFILSVFMPAQILAGSEDFCLRQQQSADSTQAPGIGGEIARAGAAALNPKLPVEANWANEIERVLMEEPNRPTFVRAEIPEERVKQSGIATLLECYYNPRIRWQLTNILLDPAEIRCRQEAVQEIMTLPRPDGIKELLSSSVSSEEGGSGSSDLGTWKWLTVCLQNPLLVDDLYYWARYSNILSLNLGWSDEIDFWEAVVGWVDEEGKQRYHHRKTVIDSLNNRKIHKATDSTNFDVYVTNWVISTIQTIFNDMRLLKELLSDARSKRLSDIRWIASAVDDPEHPYQLYELAQAPDNFELVLKAIKDGSLAILLRASREVETYTEIAERNFCGGGRRTRMISDIVADEHYEDKMWPAKPEILDPNENTGPQLVITNGKYLSWGAGLGSSGERCLYAGSPNSVSLGRPGPNSIVITGPNTNGKTAFLRMATQHVALASIGSNVPAESVRLTPMAIDSHIGLQDEPEQGLSLFDVEAREMWSSLNKARQNPFRLMLFDEMALGTDDAGRHATEEIFSEQAVRTGALVVIATHNFGLTGLEEQCPGRVANFNVDQLYGVQLGKGSPYVHDQRLLKVLAKHGWDGETRKAVEEEIRHRRIGREVSGGQIPPVLAQYLEYRQSVIKRIEERHIAAVVIDRKEKLEAWEYRLSVCGFTHVLTATSTGEALRKIENLRFWKERGRAAADTYIGLIINNLDQDVSSIDAPQAIIRQFDLDAPDKDLMELLESV